MTRHYHQRPAGHYTARRLPSRDLGGPSGGSVRVGFLQRLAGQAGGDDAGEFGARGDVLVWTVQRVGDCFSRGLDLGDLVVEVGKLTVGELPPAVDEGA